MYDNVTLMLADGAVAVSEIQRFAEQLLCYRRVKIDVCDFYTSIFTRR